MCKARVAAYGYPCEEYQVTTEDGYILSLKRIPHGYTEDRTPVLLFHGLMVDGFCWVLSTPKQSLGFILADGGFDVWIANCRGTKSSRKHTTLTPEDPAFWDFTWDELAAYDLPAVLQFVYNQTGGKKVHYVGHSLGTLIILAAFSEHKLIDIVRSAVLLCPIAYLHRMRSRLILLAARIFLAETIHMLGFHEFNPVGRVAQEVLGEVCTDPEVDCYDLFGAVAGPDCCLNTSTTCIFLQHGPQSTSVKNMIHMSQCKKSFSETTAQSPVAALTFLFLKCSGQESWGQKVRLWKREGEHEALQSARAPAVQPLVHSTPCPLVPHPWWPRFSR